MPVTDDQLRAVTVGELTPLDGPITLVDYDPAWPHQFEVEAQRVRAALGERALRRAHVGSTSVPGLVAKPIIDLLLIVADSSNEAAYVPVLERAGYVLRIREPDWYQHRLFKGPAADINLHVWSDGCPEIDRMLRFRDWLRANPVDRARYADAKSEVVEAILRRAQHP